MRLHLQHVEEAAEQYALGLLAGADSDRLNAHVRVCPDCAERVGRAEVAVTAMLDASLEPLAAPRTMLARVPNPVSAAVTPTHRWRLSALNTWTTAAAAAFALTSGSLAVQNGALRTSVTSDGNVFAAMVHSHFSHAQFSLLNGKPIAAKVLYERHGAWYEIVATGINPNSRLAIVRGRIVQLASERFVARGNALLLTLAAHGKITELRLLDAHGSAFAHVRPQ